jgi:hypothetical protein
VFTVEARILVGISLEMREVHAPPIKEMSNFLAKPVWHDLCKVNPFKSR